MILLLDNYDSFTYNLYQYICELNKDVLVLRNNETSLDKIEELNKTIEELNKMIIEKDELIKQMTELQKFFVEK